MTLAVATHEHRTTCHHRMYGLTCPAYDALKSRAGGRCEVCNVRAEDVQKRPLYIDHDNRRGDGWTHVRGLVCSKCNSGLRYVDNGTRTPSLAQRHYLANAWFLTQLPAERRDAPPNAGPVPWHLTRLPDPHDTAAAS